MENEQESPVRPRTQIQGRVLLLTICAAGIGGTFQFGYNLSIINAPTLHIQEFTNQTWQARTGQPLPDRLVLLVWSLIVSLYPLGGLFGALLAGPLAIMLGRKKSLLMNNIFVVAAAVLFGFSHRAGSFEMIMLGRLLMGVSAGVSMNIQPMYLGESAPKEFRGAVAMTSATFTALGIVMGQVVGLRELLGGPQAWPLLLASCLVPGVLQLASLPLLPESPRYLLIDRGDTEGCLKALQRLRGTEDLVSELAELEEERAACQGLRAHRPWELFRDGTLRRQVMSLVVLSSAMELCGNDSMYAYASSVFREAGVPQEKVQYAIIGTGCCELFTAFVSCMIIERVGRRVLLIGGYCLMTCWGSIFTVALGLQSSFPWTPYLAMACIFAFILSFGIGPAGVTGILATELFDQMARPAAYMVFGALMWTMLFLVGLGFPFIMDCSCWGFVAWETQDKKGLSACDGMRWDFIYLAGSEHTRDRQISGPHLEKGLEDAREARDLRGRTSGLIPSESACGPALCDVTNHAGAADSLGRGLRRGASREAEPQPHWGGAGRRSRSSGFQAAAARAW